MKPGVYHLSETGRARIAAESMRIKRELAARRLERQVEAQTRAAIEMARKPVRIL